MVWICTNGRDQPLLLTASPTTLSPGYIADFDPEEDEEDLEEDLADHLADGGDNDDNESSDDDDNDDDMILSPQAENTEAFETDESAGITEFAAALPSSSPPPENVESLKDNIRETMTTVNQGMSVEEIERVVAQRVANAIEAIAIYETKTNMARNHNGQCTIKGGNCKKVDHMTRECRNPTAARNQRTHTCYKCGSLRHFKSKCLIVKFQKRVNKKISTLSERQAENKEMASQKAYLPISGNQGTTRGIARGERTKVIKTKLKVQSTWDDGTYLKEEERTDSSPNNINEIDRKLKKKFVSPC
ncbi:reverse transcriptase domain-containing protein [Tanacetum coccineum]|uniref:Reverse transcriptase domain-containing protein n=1 Tax=Tanacetum coccineum TaxID=301880 RepID=A0ABQ5BJ93_9ASTR